MMNILSQSLAGTVVVDLSRLLPGPMASAILADHGALVIEVDAMTSGGGAVTSTPLPSIGQNKKSVRLNLRTAKGHEILMDLVRGADVVLESFRPGAAAAMGVDYDSFIAVNPRLIFCSITGYGTDGANREKSGHDINFMAESGLMDLFTPPREEPKMPAVQAADVIGGALQAVVAILLALHKRSRTGIGRRIDISMANGALPLAAVALDLMRMGMPYRMGESVLTGALGCYGFYKAADGVYLAVGSLEEKIFSKLCDLLGCPELKPLQYDLESQNTVKERLAAIFGSKTSAEWIEALGSKNVCVSAMVSFKDAVEASSQPQEPGPGWSNPARLYMGPVSTPARGADTRKVLRTIGISESELDSLAESGVI